MTMTTIGDDLRDSAAQVDALQANYDTANTEIGTLHEQLDAAAARIAELTAAQSGPQPPQCRLGRNNSTMLPGHTSDRIYISHYTTGELDSCFARAAKDIAAGAVPVVSMMYAQNGIKFADVAAGKHNDILDDLDARYAKLKGPFVRIDQHEPDNSKNRPGGTAAEFCAMQDFIKNRAKPNANCTWAVNPTGGSLQLYEIYGGADADLVAGDRYNWAFCIPHDPDGSEWRSFEAACAPLVAAGQKLHKPIAVFESGCMPDPSNAARKPDWWAAAAVFAKKAGLKFWLAFEGDAAGVGHGGWKTDDSPRMHAVIASLAKDPYFIGTKAA